MKHRKSPIRHSVRSHSRDGYSVINYERGQGKAPRVRSTLIHKPRVRIIQTREERLTKLKVGTKSRKEWINWMWNWGHKGRVDFNINAKTKTPPDNMSHYAYWKGQSGQPISDLIESHGFDRSRKDVLKFKSKIGNNVYVGSGSDVRRRTLGFNSRRILRNYFTGEEVKAMGGLFLEASSPGRGSIGSCARYPRYKSNYVMIKEKSLDYDKVITHELIHAMRWGLGNHTRDSSREEKETELETICRVSEKSIMSDPTHGGGYYQYLPSVKRGEYWREQAKFDDQIRKAMLNDRKLILRDNKLMKGKALRRRINEVYPQTDISKAHFSPAEMLDRYFIVRDEGVIRELHVRYDKPTTLEEIKKEFIEEYGKDVTVWEWRDNKKVKIISPSKSKRWYSKQRIVVDGQLLQYVGSSSKRINAEKFVEKEQVKAGKTKLLYRIIKEENKFRVYVGRAVSWSRAPTNKKVNKKQIKIDEINEAIQRSEWAKGVNAKAELRKDGSILYSQNFQASHGKYKGKISFNQVLSYLDGKDARDLIRKYGRGKHAQFLRSKHGR